MPTTLDDGSTDSRCAPQQIGFRHLADQLPDLAVLSRPPWAVAPGEASPVGGETPSMPSKNRFRLDDDECLFPVSPGSGQESPEEAIELPELRSPTSSIQNGELLAEREVFECQLRAEPQGGWNQREQPENHRDHAWEVSGPAAQKVNRINAAGVLAKDRCRHEGIHSFTGRADLLVGPGDPDHCCSKERPLYDADLLGNDSLLSRDKSKDFFIILERESARCLSLSLAAGVCRQNSVRLCVVKTP